MKKPTCALTLGFLWAKNSTSVSWMLGIDVWKDADKFSVENSD